KRGLLPEPPRRVLINEAVCEGCGDCGTKSNCLSVLPRETEFGEKRHIHDLSCNRDYTCLEGDCPSFVTVTPKKAAGRRWPKPNAQSKPSGGGRRAGRPTLPSGALPAPTTSSVERRYGIYFTGVGGTGVVTANRIIAAAAESAGYAVGGLDQTGLSQKAGAVVSHLHLAADREALGSAAVGPGGADLYLSGDILQAAGPAHLERVNPGRTIAVIDPDVTPTAAMLQSDLAVPDLTVLRQAVVERVGAGRVAFIASKRIAEAVFANHVLANVVLLGAAFQLGGLPVGLDDVDTAMPGRTKTSATNREAFEWGRWAAHDPDAVEAALAATADVEDIFDPSPGALAAARRLVSGRALPAELGELLTRRAAQAVDYQDEARATRFLDLVEETAGYDETTHSFALTRAVAESWFKLLTYKDEYEVARLHLKVDYDRVARDLGIEGPYSVTYHLHPPILRRLGMAKKLPLGRPYAVAFHALRGMKRLRGTPFDVFGWDRDRRTERAVIEEYERLVKDCLPEAGPPGYDLVVRVAESALEIKGYGPIKEDAVVRWRQHVADLRRPPPNPPAGSAAGTATGTTARTVV
ncbi:MAG: DUF6537 domain-containing protein, partial [Frankia sp.]